MTKNIFVTDEYGRSYENTWPKRAKGLVRNGRARWVEQEKICLTYPPNESSEENAMAENKQPAVSQADTVQPPAGSSAAPDMQYVLTRIDSILNQTAYLHEALEATGALSSQGPGDVAGQAKGEALGKMVEAREATNRELLRFFEKMYDDLKPPAPQGKTAR